MSKGKLAIVGVGEVPTGTYPQRSRWDIIYDTCIQAVRDAGIDKNDIEGVITVAPQAQPRLAAEISFGKIPEELGLENCKDVCVCNAGGASTSNCLRFAELVAWARLSVMTPVLTKFLYIWPSSSLRSVITTNVQLPAILRKIFWAKNIIEMLLPLP